MITRKSRPGQESLDTPAAPAPAGRARPFVRFRPWHRIVAPFACDAVGAGQGAIVDDEAAADSGAENDAEHRAGSRRSTIPRFGQGETVRIVREATLAAESLAKIGGQWLAVQPRAVRVLYEPGFGRNGAWNADSNAGGAGQFDSVR